MEPKLIQSGEACRIMGISHATLLNWKKRGLIKPAAETPTGRDLWDEEEITKINKRSER